MSKYIGTPVVNVSVDTVDVTGDITTTDTTPEVIIVNNTHEDTDGGREGKVTFKGQQSGGEETTLAQIQASHDGTSDDEKGDLIFKTNDGSDGASPTEAMRIDSSGQVGIGITPTEEFHLSKSASGADVCARIQNTAVSSGDTATLRFSVTSNSAFDSAFVGSDRNNSLILGSNEATRMTIDSSGNVGINDTTPSHKLDVNGNIAVSQGSRYYLTNDSGFSPNITNTDASNAMQFFTGYAERMRIDSSGNLLHAKSSSNVLSAGVELRASGLSPIITTTADDQVCIFNRQNNDGNILSLRQAGTVEGTISVSGTTVSYNGGHLSRWSQLTNNSKDTSIVKGTVMTNLDQMAVWSHDAVAATYYEEGDVLPVVTEATYYEEGDTIPEGSDIGDVKTEAVYAQVGDEKTTAVDAYTEDNEQLNCMAVSSVEGDANVAGVFVNWDNTDDGFNDMNVAMTGDMVIRIAQGTTVARGDLLMSAGDGTAKPQGDDIVRSKTIAKVTSTNVSHTYDDGSYLVPCVLMAC